jgi:dihydroxyacetone kinase-like protein
VREVAGVVNDRSRSFGIALTACTTPAAGKPGFDLPEDEVEVGVGIHGEPGRRREALAPARDLVEIAVGAVDDDLPVAGQELLVMVNGLGGTPLVELYVAFNEVAQQIAARGGRIARSLVGNYITSLDMSGFTVTVCRLTEDLTSLWDAPVSTPALRWGI